MYRKTANIIFVVIIALTLVAIAITLDFIPVGKDIKQFVIIGFFVLINVGVALILRQLSLLEKDKSKEKIKIVYKDVKKKEKEDKDLDKEKEAQRVKNITSYILDGIDNISTHEKFSEKLLSNFSKKFDIVQGIVYLKDKNKSTFSTSSSFASYEDKTYKSFEIGEGITGQVAKNKKFLYIDNIPENYITILSGLGEGNPKYLAFLPIVSHDQTIAVIEFATFDALPEPTDKIFDVLSDKLTTHFEKYV